MVSLSRVQAYKKGHWAEGFARVYLTLKGYGTLEKRYKTHFGEIDLIMRKGNLIVFIEVKLRKNMDDALGSVSSRNRKRIENAALYFISEYAEYSHCDFRFDVFAVVKGEHFIRTKFVHLDNAWLSGS